MSTANAAAADTNAADTNATDPNATDPRSTDPRAAGPGAADLAPADLAAASHAAAERGGNTDTAPSPPSDPAVLTVVAGGVDGTAADIEELGASIIGLAGRIAASTCRWLLLVADFDAREGCARYLLATTARWLTHYCGLAPRTAKEHVRVARSLAQHPNLAAAMASGRLSFSHVRAISRIADLGDESLVDELISVAEHGSVGQLEVMVRGLRSVDDNERGTVGTDDKDPDYVSQWWGPDSRWRMNARLDPEDGALVRSALAGLARSEGLTPARALVRMAEIARTAMNDGTVAAQTLRGHEQAAVVVHLDASRVPAAADDPSAPTASDPGGVQVNTRPYARIENGPGLSDWVIKRLLCAGRLRTARYGGGSLLDVGRSQRLVSERMFLALLLRDGGCQFPGCRSRHGLEAHHIRHWLHGGRTDLRNLVLLCRRHHHAHHDGRFHIVRRGRWRLNFVRADGFELPNAVDPRDYTDAGRPVEDEHPDVVPAAATTAWDGTRLDHDYAISTLAAHLAYRRAGDTGPKPTVAEAG